MTILIIGAGAAGLTAGYTLRWEGVLDFRILEASSTHLGRVKKNNNFTDFPVDIGGEWIHVDPSILDTIVDDLSCVVDVETTPYKPEYFWWDGVEMSSANLQVNDFKFVDYTWYDFFNDYIAVDVLDKITFDCQVTNIDWGGGNSSSSLVNVTCLDGSKFSASQVIITVPVKILQDEDIDFNPALPNDFMEAVNTPYMAPGFKAFLKFRTAFYPEAFSVETDFTEDLEYWESDRFFYDATYGQDSADHILGVAAFGEIAARFVNSSNDQIVQTILADLDAIFDGAATANFVSSMVQNWNAEPFVRGAYSFYEGEWSAIDTMRIPLNGRLFFAGEAIPIEASDYANGFVHGAALSGRRAAKAVMMEMDKEEEIVNGEDGNKQEGKGVASSSAASLEDLLHMGPWFPSALLFASLLLDT